MTEESIGALFAGAMIPGILAAFLYMIAIRMVVCVAPKLRRADPIVAWRDRGVALAGMWDALLLIVAVIGGIYAGLFPRPRPQPSARRGHS